MRILWLCNIMLPAIAEQLQVEASNKEGWLTGLSNRILAEQQENSITLGICFPVGEKERQCDGKMTIRTDAQQEVTIYAYGFLENSQKAEQYQEQQEERFREIIDAFKPDLIHCFGTEYPHTLAITKAFERPDRIMIGIQGLCAVYADHYQADLPAYVWNRTTFRDWVKKDNLKQQKEKYIARGKFEMEAIRLAGHVTGRTDWDKKYTSLWNPKAKYHFMNETLRANFYKEKWELKNCQKYSIFISQGDYPIKGLHYMIQALPEILEHYPGAEIYVAGSNILKAAPERGMAGVKGRLKLDSYGKYLYDLLREKNIMDKVKFLGKCDAEKMKQEYLKSHVFVCPSAIENSPNSVGEAMLLGVPTICAEVGGIPSIFQKEVDGYTYQVADTKALAEVVIRVFQGGDSILSMAENARKHARTRHDPNQNYHALMKIYQEILEE